MTSSWKKSGISRLLSACKNSWNGLKVIYKDEAAFRQELLVVLPLLIIAFMVGDNNAEIALLWLVGILVLLAEIFNSAIEAVVDRIGLEHHPLSGRAKDLGSLAVLLSLVLMVAVWTLVIF